MDVVLGVSMALETVRMVLVEGQDGDGVTVEEDSFDTATAPALAMSNASEQVVAAILGTFQGAAEAGHHLVSTGVTWTDQAEAGALREALAAHKVENVMLVSAFLAAAALTETVGNAVGYEHIAMLFVEPDTATLAVVDSADGSITDVRRQPLTTAVDPVLALISMVASVSGLASRPEGLFVVGSGVDIAAIKPRLEAATPLAVSAPEEPETALARGAALASANAPLFASSTAALAYAQDPGTGEVDSFAYADYVDGSSGASDEGLAYSAADDEGLDGLVGSEARQRRSPMLLVGSTLATIVVGGVVALAISLAIGIRPTVALRPEPGQNLIVPAQQPPSPPAAQAAAPEPQAMHQSAVPVVAAAAPAPVVSPPVAAAAPPVPVPVAAPAPVPIPGPAPVAVPAPAAVPIPVPVPVPAAPVRIPSPQPPVQLPAPQPPVHVPPVRVPQPPVQIPQPPVRVPNPPLWQPNPPVHVPSPPVQLPAPQPPINLGSPQPPVHMPAPQPPINLGSPEPPVHLPAPQAPAFPAMPAPAAPRFPAMPAPAMPAPAMPAPAMPHFSMPAPAFRF